MNRPPSLLKTVFSSGRLALPSLLFILTISILCFAAPWIAPHSHTEQNIALGATPPSLQHWMGTDEHGRDLFSRILHGGRISFAVGLLATLVSLCIGVAYGSLSGFVGGLLDRLMMRSVEIIQALPFTLFVILLIVLFDRHFWLLFVAIGAVEWPTMARIVRSQVLGLRQQTFIHAADALGQSHRKTITLHILPNIAGTIAVYTTLTIPSVMLLEAFISFLGLGVQPPMTSWGSLIKNGADSMEDYPWLLLFPSVVFALTLFALNFLGDSLRDALDPRTFRNR